MRGGIFYYWFSQLVTRKGGRQGQSRGCLKFKRVFGYNQIFIKNNHKSDLCKYWERRGLNVSQ